MKKLFLGLLLLAGILNTTQAQVILSGSYGFDFIVRPGVIFFLNKHLSLEASYGGISFETLRINEGERVNAFQAGLNNAAYGLGVNWLF
jgi:hypothetical protein